jgi:deoxycytidine triphosphate deaminase
MIRVEEMGIFEADGGGSFSNVEFNEDGSVLARSLDVKSSDVSGAARLYFDNRRNEVLTGRLFEPIGGRWLLRTNVCYRIITNLIAKIPEDMVGIVRPRRGLEDVLMVNNMVLYPGFDGRIEPIISTYRKLDLEPFVSLVEVVLFPVGSLPGISGISHAEGMRESEHSKPKKSQTKSKSSTGTKKSKEVSDEGSVSGKPTDDTES